MQQRGYINQYTKQLPRIPLVSVLKVQTLHILGLSVCERRQGLGLLCILLKISIKDVRTRFLFSFILFEYSSCFSSQPWVRGCDGLADTGNSDCMASSQHSKVVLADLGSLQPALFTLPVGPPWETIKFHFSFM